MDNTLYCTVSAAPRRWPRVIWPSVLILCNALLGLAIALLLGESIAQIAAYAMICAAFIVIVLAGLALVLAILAVFDHLGIAAIFKEHIAAMQASLRRSLPALPDEGALLVQRLNEENEADEEVTEPRQRVAKESGDDQSG